MSSVSEPEIVKMTFVCWSVLVRGGVVVVRNVGVANSEI